MVQVGEFYSGEANHRWVGDKASYDAIHKRIRRERGRAADRKCIDCGNDADNWSHEHDTDPLDVYNYDPRCISCHCKYDGRHHNLGW
jgi:hypothetical protein